MKKVWLCLFVVAISLGVVAVMGGCDNGGGGGDVPKSSSAYAGSNMAAVIDSQSAWHFDGLLGDIGQIMSMVDEPPVDLVGYRNRDQFRRVC